jgi:hypothetical protein
LVSVNNQAINKFADFLFIYFSKLDFCIILNNNSHVELEFISIIFKSQNHGFVA